MFIPPNVSGPTPREIEEQKAHDPQCQAQALGQYVVDCLNHHSKPADIRASLVAKGLTESEAKTIVQQVMQSQAGGQPFESPAGMLNAEEELALLAAVGRRNMAIGGLFFVIGAFVTLLSLGNMTAGGGGVIAWGAIVFGGIQFFRGLAQLNQARS